MQRTWTLAAVQNQPQRAIEHLKRVLEISKEVGDHQGDEDVNGTIADILTGMGEFAEAAKYFSTSPSCCCHSSMLLYLSICMQFSNCCR